MFCKKSISRFAITLSEYITIRMFRVLQQKNLNNELQFKCLDVCNLNVLAFAILETFFASPVAVLSNLATRVVLKV